MDFFVGRTDIGPPQISDKEGKLGRKVWFPLHIVGKNIEKLLPSQSDGLM